MRFLHTLAVAAATCVALFIEGAYTSNLYAFLTSRGIQVAAQDPDTANIIHSTCNSLDSLVFPMQNPNVLPTLSKPRNGTALAASGWWDESNISASIFFQNEDGDIANDFCKCDMKTGQFNCTGEWSPSVDAGVDSVHNETGLSVQNLGQEDGYRLFYHNRHRQVMMLSYNSDAGWTDGGPVSQATGRGIALASAYRENKYISVVSPRFPLDIEVALLEEDNLWQLDNFPRSLNDGVTNETMPSEIKFNETATPKFSLPFWDPDTQAIGHTAVRHGLREVYYIGTDKTLYQVRESDTGDGWTLGPNVSLTNWPKADKGSGGLAVVSPSKASGEVWIYYWADGAIIQAHKSASGVWDEAFPIPNNATDKWEGHPPNKEEKPHQDVDTSGWSTAVKAGVGVGVSAGALALGVLTWFFVRRHRSIPHSDPKSKETDAKDQNCDLPEVYIVQKATPIRSQSTGSSAGENQLVELEQPVEVYELMGRSESNSVRA
ncbi:hypothetical protein LCI18_013398 [Fusarium solani-melongenae]|uniref:Uncharacterized protein n=1 Tax=Fusarium solani subsp. cucurbitae TaxID=2747967 RepID=A0ACD3ZN02_FUSSC|nr:hypothetical protein LCI18_013398 [Fusarium solani-melongenae]